jgi:hypothetical protein
MEPLVAEIMSLIEAGADDPCLRWSPDQTAVQAVFSRLILDRGRVPAAPGSRAGFGDTWRAAMAEHGWQPTGPNGLFAHRGYPGN